MTAGQASASSGQARDSDAAVAETAQDDATPPSDQLAQIFSPEETILIFDWDDTVLPSTWIARQGLRLDDESVVSAQQRADLCVLEAEAFETFKVAMEHGEVVVVTNAEAGWIELSCKKFFPGLTEVLHKVRVASARTMFESATVQSPFEWKYKAFAKELEGYVSRGRVNVVSFGDSQHEREAIIRATHGLAEVRTKSLKFVERPEVDQLRKEHQLIRGCLRQVIQHDGNLDLCIRAAA